MDYSQLDIFDMILPKFQIDKPIRLIELFAGVGSQAMALRDLGADFEHYRVVELDRFAVASYNAIHGTGFEPADITKVSGPDLGITDTDKYCYIMTYSFPCQDLSTAGKRKGMAKGSGTRSGLLWEVERLLDETGNLPQVLLMENVPQVHSQENMPDFQKWMEFLEGKGYSNCWQDLNAKDYGVAQNRNRCFMVSLLGEWGYKFPQPVPLGRKLRDYLEDEVDEKYYISNEKAQQLIRTLTESGTLQDNRNTCYSNDREVSKLSDVAKTISARDHKGFSGSFQEMNAVVEKVLVDLSLNNPSKKTVSNCITAKDRGISNQQSAGNGVVEWKKRILGSIYGGASSDFQRGVCPIARCVKAEKHDLAVVEMEERRLGNVYGFDGGNYAGNVYDDKALSPTIRTYQGGNQQPMIVAMRGRNPDNPSDRTAGSPTEQRLEPNSQGVCNTLTSVQKDNLVMEKAVTTQGNEIMSTIRASISKCGIANVIRNCELGSGYGYEGVIEPTYRIRKLTPLECWRLMGFSDEDFSRAAEVNSNTQLYKQAGNSIVKDVLMAIFGQML